MIQSKNNDLHNRPNKNSTHTNPHDHNHERYVEKKCDCSEGCKCGCQEGKPCDCGNLTCASGIASGVFSLLGACFIVGTMIYSTERICAALNPRAVGHIPQVHAANADMNTAIASYIKNHPEVIVSSLEAYGRKQQQQAPQPVKEVDAKMLSEIIGDKTNHVLGNPKGSFIMIEFFDYNCGYCKKMNKAMAEAIKKSDNIRWILMDAPIFGEKSEIIARYAYAAAKQGKFAEYHAALGEASDKTEEGLKAIGKKLGLNVDKLAADANSDEAKAKLVKTREYTTKLGLSGVPMFIIDGKVQTGAFPDEQMEEYIKKANATKRNVKRK